MPQTPNIAQQIEQDEPLAGYTTMAVGGVARYFIRVTNTVELVEAVQYAITKKWPIFILGGGSNVVISDHGFDGLVIKNESAEILIDPVHSLLQADSGVKSGKVAAQAASAGLSGAEFLFGIPGTIGGAVYGNAGLRGHEIKDILKDVILLTVTDGKAVVVKKSAAWLEYKNRESRLKRDKEAEGYAPIIISARLQLYPARREVILERMQDFQGHRRGGTIAGSKVKHGWQPTGLKSSGCIFRNPSPDPEQAAGRLLDLAGAKRLTHGGAAVAKEHANFIYNRRNASAADIYELMQACRAAVAKSFDVDLQTEVEFVGRFDDPTTE